MTLGERLDITASKLPDKDAIIFNDTRMNWSEVREESRLLARAFMALGLNKGDRIAIWMPNNVEWMLLWLAAAYAGATVVPVNSRYKKDEAEYILDNSGARILITTPSFRGIQYEKYVSEMLQERDRFRNSEETVRLGSLEHVFLLGGPSSSEDVRPFDDLKSLADQVEDELLEQRSETLEYTDPTIIVYTSGTTGRPKGAVHSHKVMRNMHSFAARLEVSSSSVILGHMPFFHVAGALGGPVVAVITGASLAIMSYWDPGEALQLIESEGVTVMGGIPTHFIDFLTHPHLEEHELSSLRTGWIGGASIPSDVVDGASTRLGMHFLLPLYGMTETTGTTTMANPDDARESLLAGKGTPLSDFEVKIVDSETAEELPALAEGEICVRGHSVMLGYFENPAATRAVIDDDGWFHTGDLGVIDDDGYLSITGRKSDMFIVGGSNAYPAEIEAAISEMPGVRQAHVVGVPDDRLGEVGVAFVERHAGSELEEAEVISYCRDHLANYKVPRSVKFVSEWPLTPTGKIERYKLKEWGASG